MNRSPRGLECHYIFSWILRSCWTQSTNWVGWCSYPYPPTPLAMASNSQGNWSWNTRKPDTGREQDIHQLLTPITPRPGSGHTWKRGMNYWGWKTRAGQQAGSSFPVIRGPGWKIQLMESSALPGWLESQGFSPWIAYKDSGSQRCLHGEVQWDGDLGTGPSVVCHTIWSSSRSTLWHCPRPAQVSFASHGKGWPVKYFHVGGHGSGEDKDLPKPCWRDQITRSRTRVPGGMTNYCTSPWLY